MLAFSSQYYFRTGTGICTPARTGVMPWCLNKAPWVAQVCRFHWLSASRACTVFCVPMASWCHRFFGSSIVTWLLLWPASMYVPQQKYMDKALHTPHNALPYLPVCFLCLSSFEELSRTRSNRAEHAHTHTNTKRERWQQPRRRPEPHKLSRSSVKARSMNFNSNQKQGPLERKNPNRNISKQTVEHEYMKHTYENWWALHGHAVYCHRHE